MTFNDEANIDAHYVDPKNFDGEGDIDNYFRWVNDNGKADFILCIMDQKNTAMYSSIKRISERKYGILTQCITMKSVNKANGQLIGMVLMKINAKLGGVACSIDWSLLSDRHGVIFNSSNNS